MATRTASRARPLGPKREHPHGQSSSDRRRLRVHAWRKVRCPAGTRDRPRGAAPCLLRQAAERLRVRAAERPDGLANSRNIAVRCRLAKCSRCADDHIDPPGYAMRLWSRHGALSRPSLDVALDAVSVVALPGGLLHLEVHDRDAGLGHSSSGAVRSRSCGRRFLRMAGQHLGHPTRFGARMPGSADRRSGGERTAARFGASTLTQNFLTHHTRVQPDVAGPFAADVIGSTGVR